MRDTNLYITEVFTSDKPRDGTDLLVPSLVFPGTEEALRRGCVCPAEENINRLKLNATPLLRKDCRVHSKVCQSGDCGHGKHTGMHDRCEHCTNVLHVCVVCEAVYLEDGDDPSLVGWKFVENDPIVKGWRCTRCR